MKVCLGRLTWDGDEGHAKLAPEFHMTHRVAQIDALTDWIAQLTETYNVLLAHNGGDYRPDTTQTLGD